MEEKILFKVKTHKFLSLFTILVILLVTFLTFLLYQKYEEDMSYYDSHTHTFDCVNDAYGDFSEKDYKAKSNKYSSLHEYITGEYHRIKNSMDYCETSTDCLLLSHNNNLSAARQELFEWNYENYVVQLLFVSGIGAFLFVPIILIKLKKYKLSVTENSIYGKKGLKKFDISFSNITEIIPTKKGVIIKTKSNRVKLSPLKNRDEIYNYIKPFVPEKEIIQQSTNIKTNTNTVDDIKLF